ncbi:MAG TPA: Rieske 2Fe-2S domain-containing protein [Actinomycetota bacterium]
MSRETIAIIIVAVLFGQFLILLVASLIRSRAAARRAEEREAPAEEAKEERAPAPVSRRDFFRRSLLASLGLFAAQFGAASLAFLWPTLREGFGAVIDLGISADEILGAIQDDRQPFYYGAGRFYLVAYDASQDPDGMYEGLVDGGLMALYQKCVHLGCRVPFCEQSQWFECPCHGSKYNRAGEYRDGPAPRGLDRFAVRIDNGNVTVDTSSIIEGPARGEVTIQAEPEGPFCINITAEE